MIVFVLLLNFVSVNNLSYALDTTNSSVADMLKDYLCEETLQNVPIKKTFTLIFERNIGPYYMNDLYASDKLKMVEDETGNEIPLNLEWHYDYTAKVIPQVDLKYNSTYYLIVSDVTYRNVSGKKGAYIKIITDSDNPYYNLERYKRTGSTPPAKQNKEPDREFQFTKSSYNLIMKFEKGFKQNEVDTIYEDFNLTNYRIVLTMKKYYDIFDTRPLTIYFLKDRNYNGIDRHPEKSASRIGGFYNNGSNPQIYIFYTRISQMKEHLLHEYAHYMNNHYANANAREYMDEGMAFYLQRTKCMNEGNKINMQYAHSDYKTYSGGQYLFGALELYLGGDERFPDYFRYLKDYYHAGAFYKAFGIWEDDFEKIYKEKRY